MNNILAAIDIGTNSFHLVIAKIDSKNRFTVVTKTKEVVRLGNSSNDMKYISKESIERGVEALKRFKLICDSHNAEIIAVATSATREALNKDEFLNRVFEETGIEINIVSGYEEARLIYLGVLQSLDIYKKKILLVDIGGGSTEFLIGKKGNVKIASSLKLGAVRLTRKFDLDDKVEKTDLKSSKIYVKGAMNQIVRTLQDEDYELVIGSSGTISNIGSIIMSENTPVSDQDVNMNGFVIKRKPLYVAIDKIYKADTTQERLKIPGLDPKRADIITAGAVILEQIFTDLKIEKMTLSGYALREGIIMNYIQQNSGEFEFGHLTDVRYSSVIHLGERTNYDKEHSIQALKLANKIFDFVKVKFDLTDDDREYLEAATLLHDIGYYISHSDHHKHSYYLIRNADMLGFNDKEIEIIANIARYHRKSHPKTKHENYNKLDDQSKDLIKKLAGILRIADSLDRSHKSIVEDIELCFDDKQLVIELVSCKADPYLEIWGANLRKSLFEEAFGCKVKIKQKK
ncbi:MAG TPA: Ppx/GppA phosphatase family protein [Ignavibacteria bacterium]|nr:Ppx/GppA phosphatase family protein [Ignavibacteria bacterium]